MIFHSVIFLEWVSLRAELEDHQRAGSRGCTCLVAHPHTSCIHFTSGFPGQLTCCMCRQCVPALMCQLHTCCAGGQQMINRHGFISLQHWTCACPLGGGQDSFLSHSCWSSPRECGKMEKRVLHYCQLPLTTGGTTPFHFRCSGSLLAKDAAFLSSVEKG